MIQKSENEQAILYSRKYCYYGQIDGALLREWADFLARKNAATKRRNEMRLNQLKTNDSAKWLNQAP
jgi:hypothetical protein